MEEYTGVKFETVVDEGDAGDVSEFLEIDKLLGKYISPEENEGNMSMRVNDGFLVKKAGAGMTRLSENDVVLVKKIESGKVHAVGGTPSSESIMHYEIYKRRKDADIILHFHDDELMEKVRWEKVGPFPYGSMELAEAVGKTSENTDRIKIAGHGLIIIAKNKDELLKILEEIY